MLTSDGTRAACNRQLRGMAQAHPPTVLWLWFAQACDVLKNGGTRAAYNRQLQGQAREREQAAAAARARTQPPPREAPRGTFEEPQCGEREWFVPVSLHPHHPRSKALAPERAPQLARGAAERRARVVPPGKPYNLQCKNSSPARTGGAFSPG